MMGGFGRRLGDGIVKREIDELVYENRMNSREFHLKFEERRKKIERQEKEWLNMKRWLKGIEKNGKNGKLEEKKEKKGNAWMKKKGYMIMNLWGK